VSLRVARALAIGVVLALSGVLSLAPGKGGVTVTKAADLPQPARDSGSLQGIHKIQHVVIVVQENHSFDNYFGTYPGADGIPTQNGVPSVCVSAPKTGDCVAPFHDSSDSGFDPPHSAAAASNDIDGGNMDGFLQSAARWSLLPCVLPRSCSASDVKSVVGYHDARELPVYWSYASSFVLQDHLFAPTASFSLPSHLALLSGWAATCAAADPMVCKGNVVNPDVPRAAKGTPYQWTDITYLLHKNDVSWAFYAGSASGDKSRSSFDMYVNPLAGFQTVRDDGQLENIKPLGSFFQAARSGTLPAVTWVTPNENQSEHPPYSIKAGQAFVAGLVNAIMQGPDWDSTAIFVTWDEWGGYYDHEVPPVIDGTQLGIRVPGLVISSYAKQGYIDHQTLTFESYLKFIEDDFLGGQRLDPATDGRPDARPVVSEASPAIGDLSADFDFSQPPRPPVLVQAA
jgi:phospholipase C